MDQRFLQGDYFPMTRFILRLDDACETMNKENWDRLESILDKYKICPLVGIIPHCEDPEIQYNDIDNSFWEKVRLWITKEWSIALHGYNHVYSTESGGINPVNKRSEFAGETIEVQKDKIRKGVEIFRKHGIEPKIFFAPSHTFDENTLIALKEESNIRIISDTIAWDIYSKNGFTFVPQQSGRMRNLPFKTVTFCYHPNTMRDADYFKLESFLQKNYRRFIPFPVVDTTRRKSLIDNTLTWLYMRKHK